MLIQFEAGEFSEIFCVELGSREKGELVHARRERLNAVKKYEEKFMLTAYWVEFLPARPQLLPIS